VKNVSGRLLCGLRWWNETGPDGESVWVFESADPQRQINATDSKVFWITLYAVPVLWLLLALVAVLKFQFMWLTIVGMLPFHPPFSLFHSLCLSLLFSLFLEKRAEDSGGVDFEYGECVGVYEM